MLNRRKLLKQMVMVGAGFVLVPSCLSDKSKSSILLKKIKIDADQENNLAELCETIIPKTATPGAKDISAHLFVLKMVDDCMKKTDQDNFIRGTHEFEAFCKTTTGRSFKMCNPEERKSIVNSVMAMKDEKSSLALYFKTVKRLTIQAYTSSEFFLTKVQVYKIIPGKYKGCVPA